MWSLLCLHRLQSLHHGLFGEDLYHDLRRQQPLGYNACDLWVYASFYNLTHSILLLTVLLSDILFTFDFMLDTVSGLVKLLADQEREEESYPWLNPLSWSRSGTTESSLTSLRFYLNEYTKCFQKICLRLRSSWYAWTRPLTTNHNSLVSEQSPSRCHPQWLVYFIRPTCPFTGDVVQGRGRDTSLGIRMTLSQANNIL